jgi:hypothetical protein
MYTPYTGAADMLLHMNGKFTMGNCNHHFVVKFRSEQFRGVGQGMKQSYMYLWYPLCQAQ